MYFWLFIFSIRLIFFNTVLFEIDVGLFMFKAFTFMICSPGATFLDLTIILLLFTIIILFLIENECYGLFRLDRC